MDLPLECFARTLNFAYDAGQPCANVIVLLASVATSRRQTVTLSWRHNWIIFRSSFGLKAFI